MTEPGGVHHRSEPNGFLYRNHHYPPGWYFYDEDEDLYGPFNSKPHCERGLELYIRQLMEGKAPTQLSLHQQQLYLKMLEDHNNHLPDIPDELLKNILSD